MKERNIPREKKYDVRGNQAEEVRELCRHYDTDPDKLREALRAVGYDGEKLRRYLKGERPG